MVVVEGFWAISLGIVNIVKDVYPFLPSPKKEPVKEQQIVSSTLEEKIILILFCRYKSNVVYFLLFSRANM